MLPWNQYPATRPGDRIIWAPEPNSNPLLWLVGIVILEKTQSCDLRVYCPDGREVTKHDCWHADDPRCKSAPQNYRDPERGVFRLSKTELERRRLLKFLDEELPVLREDITLLRTATQNRQMNPEPEARGSRKAVPA